MPPFGAEVRRECRARRQVGARIPRSGAALPAWPAGKVDAEVMPHWARIRFEAFDLLIR